MPRVSISPVVFLNTLLASLARGHSAPRPLAVLLAFALSALPRAPLLVSLLCISSSAAAVTTQITTDGLHIVILDSSTDFTWSGAQSYALSNYGTHLASIHNSSELSSISAALDAVGCDLNVFFPDYAWIGGIEVPSNSENFSWVDGSAWDFEAWAPGNPHDEEDCVAVGDDGDIYDLVCEQTYNCLVINFPPTCGDSVLESPEECDDSNTIGGDGCSATCNIEICGNSVLDVGEECDDSNTIGGDGCSAICEIEEIVPGLDYDDAFCQQVVGTLNIHWEDVTTPETPCDGIEFTDGNLLDAADGDVTMSGTSVSNPLCIGQGIYTFSVSPDGLTLTGTDTFAGVNMTLTRTPTQSCFVGHWIQTPYDFVAHLGAEVFGAEVAPPVPSLSRFGVALFCCLLGLAGWRRLRA